MALALTLLYMQTYKGLLSGLQGDSRGYRL